MFSKYCNQLHRRCGLVVDKVVWTFWDVVFKILEEIKHHTISSHLFIILIDRINLFYCSRKVIDIRWKKLKNIFRPFTLWLVLMSSSTGPRSISLSYWTQVGLVTLFLTSFYLDQGPIDEQTFEKLHLKKKKNIFVRTKSTFVHNF